MPSFTQETWDLLEGVEESTSLRIDADEQTRTVTLTEEETGWTMVIRETLSDDGSLSGWNMTRFEPDERASNNEGVDHWERLYEIQAWSNLAPLVSEIRSNEFTSETDLRERIGEAYVDFRDQFARDAMVDYVMDRYSVTLPGDSTQRRIPEDVDLYTVMLNENPRQWRAPAPSSTESGQHAVTAPPVQVFGRSGSPATARTIATLQRTGTSYVYVDLDADRSAARSIKARGYTTLPVVDTPTGAWQGYKPARLWMVCNQPQRMTPAPPEMPQDGRSLER